MGIEADHGQGNAQTIRRLARRGDDRLMAAMDAVEGADGDGGALLRLRQAAPVANDLDHFGDHRVSLQRAEGLRRRGTRTTATPSMISLSSTKPSHLSWARAPSWSSSITVMMIRTVSPIRTGKWKARVWEM